MTYRLMLTVVLIVNVSGCAGYEHKRIRNEMADQEKTLNLPEYAGENKRGHFVYDFAHGWVWWIGTEKAHEALK